MRKFIIRLAIAAIIGTVAVVWTIIDDKPSYERARTMLANGIVAEADVASALVEKTATSTKSLILKISFTTEKGETITSNRSAPTELLKTIKDPKKEGALRPDASVEVVFFPDAPKNFEFKAKLENKVDPLSRLPVLAAIGAIPAIVIFYFLGFIPALRLRKRKSPDSAMAAVSPPRATSTLR